MSTSTPYPNGQVLVSNAYTPDAISQFFQTLTCGMLGINPPDYSLVRVAWQTQGQPFNDVNQDLCYVGLTLQDTQYGKVRDRAMSQIGPPNIVLTETWTYTRTWRCAWTLYGPNATDRARAIYSATFFDYFNDQLDTARLYLINEPPMPLRVPELINSEWWERADFHIDMYEAVTESLQDSIVTSVENKIYDNDGLVADFTVSST